MLGPAWRQFSFFESAELKDPPLLPASSSIEIVSCCLSHAYLFAGDCGGRIHIIDRSAAGRGSSDTEKAAVPATAVVASFQAYTGAVTHMKYTRSQSVLVTLGDDDALNTAVLRLWQVDQCISLCQQGGGSSGAALWRPPSREHRLFDAKHPSPSAAAGSVPVKVNLNEERLRTLRLRASSGAASPRPGASPASSPTGTGTGTAASDADGIPASSLSTVVVAFDVADDLQSCAVALTGGECVVLRGDLVRDRAVRVRRIRSGVASGRIAFVGLPPAAFVGPSSQDGARDDGGRRPQLLFTVYSSMTTVWAVNATGECTEYPCYEGSRLTAAGPGCACLSPEGQLILCTADASALTILGPKPPVSTKPATAAAAAAAAGASSHAQPVCYDPTGGSSSHTLPPSVTTLPIADGGEGGGGGPKVHRLLWHAGYVVLLSQSPTRPGQFYLQCYDPVNGIRALSRRQEPYADVAFVLSDGAGDLLVLSQLPGERTRLAYSVTALREIDTLSKLDLLFSRECYDIAKRIADRHHAQGVNPTLHHLINRRYADYLYRKGKTAEAMDEYIACIGSLEPSYVIRRYRESQYMELLTRYLEALHQRQHGYAAHVSHTTLLLNCYIRQKRGERLLTFVQQDDVRLDAPNAIAVCRQGGQYEAALLIADRYAQVYERASILIHDLHEPKEALAFIRTLGVDDAEEILKKAGKQLIAWEPLRTTDVLLQLCVRWGGPARRLPTEAQTPRSRRPARRAEAAEFLHVFVDSPVCLLNFLRGVVASGVLEVSLDGDGDGDGDGDAVLSRDALASRTAVYNTLFELYITKELRQSIRVLDGEEDKDDPANGEVGREGTTSALYSRAADPVDDDPAGEVFPVEPLPRRLEQAMALLEAYDGRYDDYVALSLCHQHRFENGTLFLLRKMHLTADLIGYYADLMKNAETPAARREAQARLLQEVELEDESLRQSAEGAEGGEGGGGARSDVAATRKSTWMTLLSLLAQSPQTDWQDVVRVLDRIEAHDLLAPTVVVDILCGPQSQLPLRAVRGYCQRALLKQSGAMKAAEEQTASRLRRIEELKQQVLALQTTAVVFPCAQCAHCGQSLDFPVVHFLCRHSFHQRCLNISTQCNLCASRHRNGLAEANERRCGVRSGEGADKFFERLGRRDGAGGFDVLAEYIRNGALGSASFTSAAVTAPSSSSRQPEASRFVADPLLHVQRTGDIGKEVYDANGNVVDAETVEWW